MFFGVSEIFVPSCAWDLDTDVDRTATGEVGSCLVTGHCVGKLIDDSLAVRVRQLNILQ